jgi:nicotinamidase-related amidase
MNDSDTPAPWESLLSDEDRARLARAGFGKRVGFGARPAVLVIDAQNYMVGPPRGSRHGYPSACGPAAERALAATAQLLAAARETGAPVVYTRNRFRRDGADMGVYHRKRGMPDTEGWCLEGSEGARIHDTVAVRDTDVVLDKVKPSAFHGTPLLGLLVAWRVDTVVITGGSTSNCVRATAVDAASHNLRTIVVADCVFDRFEISHLVSLFDLDRQYADVVGLRDAVESLRATSGDD